jgi:GNAT superfamily N-acetyltransferase
MGIKIRNAKRSDSKQIIELINELAKFEKLMPPDENAKKRLINDAFGKKPKFKAIVADGGTGKLLGYAFYFFTYSSFLAKNTLYLEDIFISEQFRNKGIGKLFFDELVKIAKKNNCGRMEWAVLDWNVNAINFYEKLGAKQLKDWIYYRFILE